MTARSAASASASARSQQVATNALTAGLTCSMRARHEASSSTGETFLVPIRRRSSIAVRSQSSAMAHSLSGSTRLARPGAPCETAAMTDRVVIVGAGQAGAQTAISLRQLGFDGRISLLGDELFPPYQRPPLSKKLMTGEMDVERTYIRSEAYYAKSGVDLRAGRAGRCDRSRAPRRAVRGRQDAGLRPAACSAPARGRAAWTLPGGDLPGVFYLRTLEDCERIKAAVAAGGARGDHRRRLYRPRDRREPQQMALPRSPCWRRWSGC